jgi:hypothetical protein
VNINDAHGGQRRGNGRSPDYIVKIGIKGERYHKRCGAAWKIKNGGIAIKIDAGLALVSGTDVVVSMWPNDEQQQSRPPQPPPNHVLEDDIPY